ncbi:hypothetical protein QWY28_13555 [Nocardioides sp. SOB77]|uniref:Uncharacterized protein n=1 Tax=Nocardioides oceani TaxID=3058369 RepID=A0ABT8FIL6_9ACTN|nr:hypothetical protein [Nocardioides oceani]MDN4173982.1 hypothetical protein [Nocardioides oceani]
MTEQSNEDLSPLDLSEVADESAEESTGHERAIVGDGPGGDTVPEDDAQ